MLWSFSNGYDDYSIVFIKIYLYLYQFFTRWRMKYKNASKNKNLSCSIHPTNGWQPSWFKVKTFIDKTKVMWHFQSTGIKILYMRWKWNCKIASAMIYFECFIVAQFMWAWKLVSKDCALLYRSLLLRHPANIQCVILHII